MNAPARESVMTNKLDLLNLTGGVDLSPINWKKVIEADRDFIDKFSAKYDTDQTACAAVQKMESLLDAVQQELEGGDVQSSLEAY